MKIITIGRQFGSGGRELGKRLSDELGIAYYDREILTEIAKECEFNEKFIENIIENGPMQHNYLTFGHTFSATGSFGTSVTEKVLSTQREVLKKLAQNDCIIVGRCADLILSDLHPFKIFVYADEESKLERCKKRATPEEANLSDKAFLKKMRAVDKGRKKLYGLFYGKEWGNPENYDLCINTGTTEIKKIVPCIADYVRRAYGEE